MRKRLAKIGFAALAIPLLVWAVPLAVGFFNAKALQGCFLIGSCGCSHDIFLLVEEKEAFNYCPGHKDKKLIGPVSRSADVITIIRARDSLPIYEIKRDNGAYFLSFSPTKGSWRQVDRITNPWRTTLRSYFPE